MVKRPLVSTVVFDRTRVTRPQGYVPLNMGELQLNISKLTDFVQMQRSDYPC